MSLETVNLERAMFSASTHSLKRVSEFAERLEKRWTEAPPSERLTLTHGEVRYLLFALDGLIKLLGGAPQSCVSFPEADEYVMKERR